MVTKIKCNVQKQEVFLKSKIQQNLGARKYEVFSRYWRFSQIPSLLKSQQKWEEEF